MFKETGDSNKEIIAAALLNYALARHYDEMEFELDIRERDDYRNASLSYSEVSLEAWNDLIRAPLQEIAAYHEGGIRSEQIANLLRALQAAGVITIGVRVD